MSRKIMNHLSFKTSLTISEDPGRQMKVTSSYLFIIFLGRAFQSVWPISQSTFKRREIIKTLLRNKSTPRSEHPPLSSGVEMIRWSLVVVEGGKLISERMFKAVMPSPSPGQPESWLDKKMSEMLYLNIFPGFMSLPARPASHN